jgi:hypothetical protein
MHIKNLLTSPALLSSPIAIAVIVVVHKNEYGQIIATMDTQVAQPPSTCLTYPPRR